MSTHENTIHNGGVPLKFKAVPGNSRLVWHPAAHEAVGERYSFFLLTAADSLGSSMIAKVRLVLERLDIHGASTNILYGTDDVLVRLWLSNARRRAFIRAIQSPEAALDLEAFLEFRADSVLYENLILESPLEQPAIQERLRELVSLFRDNPPEQELRNAVESGIADGLLVPITSLVGAKVFLFLYQQRELEQQEIRATVEAYQLYEIARSCGLGGVSVHLGSGFCDAVVQGVTERYEDTLKIVQDFQQEIGALDLLSWTLVPPDYINNIEHEAIHMPEESLQDLLEELRKSSGPSHTAETDDEDLQWAMESLQDKSIRMRIKELRSTARDKLLSDRAQRRLDSVLYSVLSANPRTLNKRLSFLISIESNLRDFLRILAVRYELDPQWFDVSLEDVQDSSGVNRYRSAVTSGNIADMLDEADLPILFALLGRLESIPGLKELEGLSIDEWVEMSSKIVDLRNKYAHGRIMDSALKADFSEEFWQMMDTSISAIAMQIELEDRVLSM